MGGHGFDISCKTPHTHKKEGGPGALGNGRLGARSATGLTLAMGGLSQRGGPSRMGGTEKGTGPVSRVPRRCRSVGLITMDLDGAQ